VSDLVPFKQEKQLQIKHERDPDKKDSNRSYDIDIDINRSNLVRFLPVKH